MTECNEVMETDTKDEIIQILCVHLDQNVIQSLN